MDISKKLETSGILNNVPFNPFPIQKLPLTGRYVVVQCMRHLERVRLALTSKTSEMQVAEVREKRSKGRIDVIISNKSIRIMMDQRKTVIHCESFLGESTPDQMAFKDIQSWMVKENSDLQNTQLVLQRIRECINFDSFSLFFHLSNVKYMRAFSRKFKAGLHLFSDCDGIHLKLGSIRARDLDRIMRMADENRYLKMVKTEIPDDYIHDNAFKWESVEYDDASWAEVDDFLTPGNICEEIHFGSSEIDSDDMNTYIHYWSNCTHDMSRVFQMDLYPNVRIEPETMFADLIVFQCIRFGYEYYVVMANKKKSRNQRVMGIQWGGDSMRMETLAVEEPLVDEDERDECLLNEYIILEALERRKRLERELKKIRKEESTEEQRERVAELEEDIAKLTEDLDSENVVYGNHFYYIDKIVYS